MSKIEKEIERLKLKPKDFTYDEAKRILNYLGFYENNKGRTYGSRVEFKNEELNKKIDMHKPHPGNLLKGYQINNILKSLNEWRLL